MVPFLSGGIQPQWSFALWWLHSHHFLWGEMHIEMGA